jgi:parvulin-like peptidyl-prolyl isomerase
VPTIAEDEEPKSTRRRRVLLAVVVAAVLIAGPAIGFFLVFVQPNDEWFVRVNGQEIKRSVLVETLRTEKIEASLEGRLFDLGSRAFGLAAELTENEVLRQQADLFGGLPASDVIDIRIRALLTGTAPAGNQAAIGESEINELLRGYLDQRRLSEASFRNQAAAAILRSQATAILGSTLPSVQPQIHVHRILTADWNSANLVLQRAEAGAPFEQLAAAYSLADDDGDLGWLPYDALPEHVADYLWSVEPLVTSLPIEEPSGEFALYVVSGRDSSRVVDPEHMPFIEDRAFEAWMSASLAEQEIEVRFDSSMLDWLAQEMAKTRIP